MNGPEISTNTHVQIDLSINLCILWDACLEYIILHLWKCLCIRDAGRRGNKIAV